MNLTWHTIHKQPKRVVKVKPWEPPLGFRPIKSILRELRALGLRPRSQLEAVSMYSAIGDGSTHAYPMFYMVSRGQHACDVRVPRRNIILKGAIVR